MITRDLPDGRLLVVDQDDHARLAGALAAHFRPRPSEGLILAALEHDNGWREWDRRPLLDPATSRPHTYMDMPSDPYVGIWERGIRRATAMDHHVGLLVSLHGMRFFQSRVDDGRATDTEVAFYRNQRSVQNALLAEGGHPESTWETLPEAVAGDVGILRFLDGASLFLVEGWGSPWEGACPMGACTLTRAKREAEPEAARGPEIREEDVRAEPFMFAGPVEVETPARILAARTFASQADLDRALAEAEVATLRWRLVPGS